MASSAGKVVYAALAGNLAIAVVKFIAFLFTRSTAMLTESIHSMVDTGDQVLLLIGQKRSKKPADASHPLGYGMETYFWSFIVALMIFLLGGAVSVYEGVHKILAPEPIGKAWINFLVLGASAVFEGASFTIAYREYRKIVAGQKVSLFRYLRISKDPNIFATLLEDGAALTGLSFAALGVLGSSVLHLPWADGAASVAIGLLLFGVAIFMANETRSLIAGESAAPSIVAAARQAVQSDDRVCRIDEVASLHLGPQSILIAVTLRFRPGLSGDDIQRAAAEIAEKVQMSDPRIGKVFLRPSGSPDGSAATGDGDAA